MIIAGAVLAVLLLAGGIWWYLKANAKPAVVVRTVKVGVFEDLAGDNAIASLSVKEGVDLAAKQLKAEGVTIQLVPSSNLCDGDKAIQAVKDLSAKGVVAIIGDVCSGAMLAAAPTANALHVVMVSPSATNPKVTDAGDYIFRVIPSDAFAAQFSAKYLYDKASVHKLAIIHSGEPYGDGLNDEMTKNFTALGGTITDSQRVPTENPDVATQMAHIKASKPDALYVAFNTSDTVPVAVLRQAKELGLTVYTSETLKDPVFVKDAGDLTEGMTCFAVSDGTSSYIEQFQGAYNKFPDVYTAQTYDAYQAIFKAVESGASTGPQIKDALYKLNFAGASGQIKFDKNGDVPPNYTVFKLVNGKFVVQDS